MSGTVKRAKSKAAERAVWEACCLLAMIAYAEHRAAK